MIIFLFIPLFIPEYSASGSVAEDCSNLKTEITLAVQKLKTNYYYKRSLCTEKNESLVEIEEL